MSWSHAAVAVLGLVTYLCLKRIQSSGNGVVGWIAAPRESRINSIIIMSGLQCVVLGIFFPNNPDLSSRAWDFMFPLHIPFNGYFHVSTPSLINLISFPRSLVLETRLIAASIKERKKHVLQSTRIVKKRLKKDWGGFSGLENVYGLFRSLWNCV
jgi:hypothetical protein